MTEPGQAQDNGLLLRAISKRYGNMAVVDGVSLDVARGEFLTLLGPSGSGKTTLLMMIAGFVAPTSGQISIGGRVITHLPPERRNFGMVFQGYALFPHLTIAGNVAFPLKVRGCTRDEIAKRVMDTLELVQLRGVADRLPSQLSGGQQQRVALARALIFTPDLLLLDEPLSALDKSLRADLQSELKQLHRRLGKTFIYVTHDQEEALSMSDRIAILRNGKIVQIASPTDLYNSPNTRFVANFLGKSNFIQGVIESLEQTSIRYRIGDKAFVQCGARKNSSVGDKLLLALRPEKIRLGLAPSPGDINFTSGEVVSLNYVGSNFHFRVRTPELGEMLVTTATWRSNVAPETGKRVWLAWDSDAPTMVDED